MLDLLACIMPKKEQRKSQKNRKATKKDISHRIQSLGWYLDEEQPLLLAHAKARRIAAYRIADIQATQNGQMELLLWTDEPIRTKVICRSGTFI